MLSPQDHTLLVLRLDREMAWEEIAAVLAGTGERVTAPALRKRYERLKGKLARSAGATGLVD
jgi:RNA polymerase sigma-70 factor (ECF subfamily)